MWRTISRDRCAAEIRTAQGRSYYWVDTTIFPFPTRRGSRANIAIARTPMRRVRVAVCAMARTLAKRIRNWKPSFNVASHDLRSPLVTSRASARTGTRATLHAKSAGGFEALQRAGSRNLCGDPESFSHPFQRRENVPLLAGLCLFADRRVTFNIEHLDMNRMIVGDRSDDEFQISNRSHLA